MMANTYLVHETGWVQTGTETTTEQDALEAARETARRGQDAIVYRDGKPWRMIRGGEPSATMELSAQGWINVGIDPTVIVTATKQA